MSAGFRFAGSLCGAAPVVRKFQVGADCYVGQLVQGDTNLYGHVIPLAVPAEAHDDDHAVTGIITGVVNSPTYDGTYYGDKATYDSAQADQVANDPIGATEVLVTLIQPYDTLIWGPIFNGAYGTALTELTPTSTDAEGDDIAHTGNTLTAPTSGLSTIYCRKGNNRGQYRLITSGGTTDQDTTIGFTYDIAVTDIYVAANVRLGYGSLYSGTTSNFIDGTTATNYYDVIYHDINLAEKGKESAIFSFTATPCSYVAGP